MSGPRGHRARRDGGVSKATSRVQTREKLAELRKPRVVRVVRATKKRAVRAFRERGFVQRDDHDVQRRRRTRRARSDSRVGRPPPLSSRTSRLGGVPRAQFRPRALALRRMTRAPAVATTSSAAVSRRTRASAAAGGYDRLVRVGRRRAAPAVGTRDASGADAEDAAASVNPHGAGDSAPRPLERAAPRAASGRRGERRRRAVDAPRARARARACPIGVPNEKLDCHDATSPKSWFFRRRRQFGGARCGARHGPPPRGWDGDD